MPSKESLAIARKHNERVNVCFCSAIPRTSLDEFCYNCRSLADLLDEATREAEIALLQKIRESLERADDVGEVMNWLWNEQQRLAQLREGKT